MPGKIRLSIITINFNNRQGLKRTIESVRAQSVQDFEYIIVDGLSTDGSPEIIQDNAEYVDKWISEKDKNEYDGMNKGIRIAAGEYVMFLNSGDTLYHADAIKNLFSHPFSEDFVYADVCIDNLYRKFIRRYPDRLTPWFLYSEMVCHQVQIIKTTLLKKLGLYDIKIPIVADYDIMARAILKNKVTYRHIPVTLSIYQLGGKSGRPEFAEKIAIEKNRIREKYFPKEILPVLKDFDADVYAHYHSIVNSRSYKVFRLLTQWNFLNRVLNGIVDAILNLLRAVRRILKIK